MPKKHKPSPLPPINPNPVAAGMKAVLSADGSNIVVDVTGFDPSEQIHFQIDATPSGDGTGHAVGAYTNTDASGNRTIKIAYSTIVPDPPYEVTARVWDNQNNSVDADPLAFNG